MYVNDDKIDDEDPAGVLGSSRPKRDGKNVLHNNLIIITQPHSHYIRYIAANAL